MARWMAETGAVPTRILSSDAVRAASTVDIVADTLGLSASCMEFRNDLYNTNTQSWITQLQRVAAEEQRAGRLNSRLLICGHNPTLDSLASALSIEPLSSAYDGKLLTTASVAHLRFIGPIGRSAGKLVALVRPYELDGFTA